MTRSARNLLGRLHLGCLCASFRGPEKEDRDRSGVLTRIDLSFPSLARVSSTLSLAGIRSWSASRATDPPFGPGRLRLATPAVEPCGSSSPVQCLPGLPFVLPSLRVSRSGLRLPVQPSGSGGRKVRAAVPLVPRSSACALEPITLRPATAGTPLLLSSSTRRPWGTSSLDWSGLTTKPPKRLPMKRFSCRSAFRCCRATSGRSLP